MVVIFRSVVLVSASDFVREVLQTPGDVWLVLLLFKEGKRKANLELVKEKLKEGNVNVAIKFFLVILHLSTYLAMNFGFVLSIIFMTNC